MRRQGLVAARNPRRGMVAIKTDDSGYTIIELLSDFELDLGDEMTWANGYGLGHEVYENLSKGTREEVFVQNHDVGDAILRKQLMLD